MIKLVFVLWILLIIGLSALYLYVSEPTDNGKISKSSSEDNIWGLRWRMSNGKDFTTLDKKNIAKWAKNTLPKRTYARDRECGNGKDYMYKG